MDSRKSGTLNRRSSLSVEFFSLIGCASFVDRSPFSSLFLLNVENNYKKISNVKTLN